MDKRRRGGGGGEDNENIIVWGGDPDLISEEMRPVNAQRFGLFYTSPPGAARPIESPRRRGRVAESVLCFCSTFRETKNNATGNTRDESDSKQRAARHFRRQKGRIEGQAIVSPTAKTSIT
ncbi:hypothetical protein F2P81_000165 [Scophthalmus maximus]|uniref:Uncharacterized protein n=1 Tax=Scophthalmus maximus TaxID=52904 RepID=A0A6A4TWV8_SCOMX|nr:hypothetical protein F2P81_000165 [Scophthalmus maximus]